MPFAPVAFAIFAARNRALLFVRGAIDGGACTTLGRGFGLIVDGGPVALLAGAPFAFARVAGFSARELFGRAGLVEVAVAAALRVTGGWLEAAADEGLAATGWSDVRDEDREYAVGFRTGHGHLVSPRHSPSRTRTNITHY